MSQRSTEVKKTGASLEARTPAFSIVVRMGRPLSRADSWPAFSKEYSRDETLRCSRGFAKARQSLCLRDECPQVPEFHFPGGGCLTIPSVFPKRGGCLTQEFQKCVVWNPELIR